LKPFSVAFFHDWALFRDGALAQRVAHVQPAVAHVEALVQALGAAAHDDDLLAAQRLRLVREFAAVHEAHLPSCSSCRRSGSVLK